MEIGLWEWEVLDPVSSHFPSTCFPSLTILLFADYRHPSPMSECIHSLLQTAPGLTLGLRMLCFPILKELSVVEVTKDTGHSLREP